MQSHIYTYGSGARASSKGNAGRPIRSLIYTREHNPCRPRCCCLADWLTWAVARQRVVPVFPGASEWDSSGWSRSSVCGPLKCFRVRSLRCCVVAQRRAEGRKELVKQQRRCGSGGLSSSVVYRRRILRRYLGAGGAGGVHTCRRLQRRMVVLHTAARSRFPIPKCFRRDQCRRSSRAAELSKTNRSAGRENGSRTKTGLARGLSQLWS